MAQGQGAEEAEEIRLQPTDQPVLAVHPVILLVAQQARFMAHLQLFKAVQD